MFWAVPNASVRNWQCFGFGFDVRGVDYKIVRVSGWRMYMIYSLKTNSWKIARYSGCLPQIDDAGVLVNNRLHWQMDNDYICQLLSFDLHDEQWREVALPNRP